MVDKNKDKVVSKKKIILRIFVLIINLVILLYLYYLLGIVGANPFIIILILIFTSFLFIGPFLKGKKKTYYSTIFPENKKAASDDLRERKVIRKRTGPSTYEEKIIPKINLNYTYKKSHIKKCHNCGMTLTSFVKKCPICGEIVKD